MASYIALSSWTEQGIKYPGGPRRRVVGRICAPAAPVPRRSAPVPRHAYFQGFLKVGVNSLLKVSAPAVRASHPARPAGRSARNREGLLRRFRESVTTPSAPKPAAVLHGRPPACRHSNMDPLIIPPRYTNDVSNALLKLPLPTPSVTRYRKRIPE